MSGDPLVPRIALFTLVAKSGKLLTPLGFLIFSQLYGVAAIGTVLFLWGYMQIVVRLARFGLGTSIQRFISPLETQGQRAALVLIAIGWCLVWGGGLALVLALAAPWLTQNAAPGPLPPDQLAAALALYALAAPLFALQHVTVSALRAERVFVPALIIRDTVEPALRLVFGVLLFLAGWEIQGLVLAHLLGFAGAAVLGLCLTLPRFRWPSRAEFAALPYRPWLRFSGFTVSHQTVRVLNTSLPLLALGWTLPAERAAIAIAILGISRQLADLLQGLRQSFDFIIGYLAAEAKAVGDIAKLRADFALATRLTLASALPLACGLAAFGPDLLALYGESLAAGGMVLAIMLVARLIDAATGPSETVLAMTGKHWMLLVNTGLAVICNGIVLSLALPWSEAVGAALAVLSGLLAMNLLALRRIHEMYRILPYDRSLVPLGLTGLALAGTLGAAAWILLDASAWLRLPIIAAILVTGIWAMLRFGLPASDLRLLDAKGRLARWVGRASN